MPRYNAGGAVRAGAWCKREEKDTEKMNKANLVVKEEFKGEAIVRITSIKKVHVNTEGIVLCDLKEGEEIFADWETVWKAVIDFRVKEEDICK